MERKIQSNKKNSLIKMANNDHEINYNQKDKYMYISSGNNFKNSQNKNLDFRIQKKNTMKNNEKNIPNEEIYKYIIGNNKSHLQRGQGFNDIPYVNSNLNYPPNYMNVPQYLGNKNLNYNYKKASSFNSNKIYNNNHFDDFTNLNLKKYNYINDNEEKRKNNYYNNKDNNNYYMSVDNDFENFKYENVRKSNNKKRKDYNNYEHEYHKRENNINNIERHNIIENNILNPQRQNNNIYQRSSSHQIMNNTNDNFFGNFFRNCGVEFEPFSQSKISYNQNYMNNNNNNNFNSIINRNQRNDFELSIDPFFDDFNFFYIGNPFSRRHFNDNFSSNFRSHNLFEHIIEMLQRNLELAEKKKHPSTSKNALKKLKKFPMSKKFCKTNDKGQLEFPNCCICLSEINSGENTVLLPCGHLFHKDCCFTWLNKNNTCPICRFELPPEEE